jgi:alcohol dehydrogenase class IV
MPTNIRFGAGSISLLAATLQKAGVKAPLLITDRGLADTAMFKKIEKNLRDEKFKVAVFSDAVGNPVKSHVTAGVVAYGKHGADGIVIVGGGCALDVGKAVALMVHHPGDLFDYEDDKPDGLPIDKVIPFVVAIPTTAGTGSEVGASSVISDDKTHAKKIMFSPRMTPNFVLADPELTVGLPAAVTAATGMDALTHCVEAYLAKSYHPICDGIALEGTRLAMTFLKRAVNDPKDIDARGGMLMASMMGAVAFQKGLGVTHSCAHALSTCYDLHHGLANALMIIPCLRFNLEVVPERFAMLGRTIGIEGNDKQRAEGFIKAVDELRLAVGIPKHLKETKGEITDRLIQVAVDDVCHGNNPRPCRAEDFRKLYAQAIGG